MTPENNYHRKVREMAERSFADPANQLNISGDVEATIRDGEMFAAKGITAGFIYAIDPTTGENEIQQLMVVRAIPLGAPTYEEAIKHETIHPFVIDGAVLMDFCAHGLLAYVDDEDIIKFCTMLVEEVADRRERMQKQDDPEIIFMEMTMDFTNEGKEEDG